MIISLFSSVASLRITVTNPYTMEKEQSIIISDMEEEFKSGLILQDTKAIGSTTRQIYMENSFIQTEILMKDNG